MNILFINGSPNSNGNTAALAKELLQGKEYETLNLTDYRIGSYGQNFEDDELDQVIAKMNLMGIPISKSSYAKIETNRMNIKVSELVALAKILDCEVGDFFKDLK